MAAIGSGIAMSKSRVAARALSDGGAAHRVGQVEQVHGRLHQRDLCNDGQCGGADYGIRDRRLFGRRCGAQDLGTLSETRHSIVRCERRRAASPRLP